MVGTFWALVPPLIAIVLALLTKEVYSSLLIGILAGALFFVGGNPLTALETTFSIMSEKVGGNTNILVFLVLLGMIVALMTRSGASSAYGAWASKSIRSKRGAGFATAGLGVLIFVDDYFNCLTVGTVMRPVTDRYHISRAKLAYLIDATAAPICIIAPISSWAAAVSTSLPEGSKTDGFSLFLQTIPFNYYALFTLMMVLFILITNFDFGKMKRAEKTPLPAEEAEESAAGRKGKVLDLVLPIVVLIVLCILSMLYTGGLFEGASIIDAFGNCNSSLSLVLGASFTLLFLAVLYLPRKIVTFTEFMNSLVDGFKAMVPAILILTFAWTLSGVCGESYLNAGAFVSSVIGGNATAQILLPAVFFLVALGLAFATGTSWGTFGILIPIALATLGDGLTQILILTVSAILAGAVCGDHISPISDTTILSSAGARCNHIEHVSTQIPYALIVAGCCLLAYLLSGWLGNGWIGLGVGAVLLLGILTVLYLKSKKSAGTPAEKAEQPAKA